MDLHTNFQGKLSMESMEVDENKCACCRRDLKSPTDRISAKKYNICDSCYRSLVYPEIDGRRQENI